MYHVTDPKTHTHSDWRQQTSRRAVTFSTDLTSQLSDLQRAWAGYYSSVENACDFNSEVSTNVEGLLKEDVEWMELVLARAKTLVSHLNQVCEYVCMYVCMYISLVLPHLF